GTFPDNPDDMADFQCPGLALFMLPQEVDDPASVLEDMIAALDLLAIELNGEKWDHKREPLTLDTLQYWRERMP
ncbi:MAG: cell division protein ZipA C-terminal FtsZ-binding domain-containing protein, partial [Methylococcales bacterium]|nr:cell division protein ZipA C-terminal FtsZ-binding domain-containing protein [Methylococcales bacterium]